MPVFRLLANPTGYNPCSRDDMHVDHEFRDYWLNHFEHHFDTVMKLAVDVYGPAAEGRTRACRADLMAWIGAVRANPLSFPRLDLLVLDQVRQDMLIAHGLPDP